VGVDVSEVALSRARARAPTAQFLLVRADEELPLDDSSFDLVLLAETIEHVRDVQLLLSEARRVLRPGGRLAVTTPAMGRLMRPPDPFDAHIRFFTRRSLRRVLDEMGFDVESLRQRGGTLFAIARR
jgi:ubiquinone/menaquinone biosynthesis C-methylase UbiE